MHTHTDRQTDSVEQPVSPQPHVPHITRGSLTRAISRGRHPVPPPHAHNTHNTQRAMALLQLVVGVQRRTPFAPRRIPRCWRAAHTTALNTVHNTVHNTAHKTAHTAAAGGGEDGWGQWDWHGAGVPSNWNSSAFLADTQTAHTPAVAGALVCLSVSVSLCVCVCNVCVCNLK